MSSAKRHAQQLQLAALSSTIAFKVHVGADGRGKASPDGEIVSVYGRLADVINVNC